MQNVQIYINLPIYGRAEKRKKCKSRKEEKQMQGKCLLWMLLLVIAALPSWSQESRGLKVVYKDRNGAGRQEQLYQKSYALLIGASGYRNGWPMLPGVKHDLTEVEKALRTHGFHIEKIEDPSAKELQEGLNRFRNQYGLDYECRILIYFAGHGYTGKSPLGVEMGYIVPVDAPNPKRDESGFLRLAMDMEQMESFVRRIYAKHVLLLFDSCFSGAIFELGRACPANIDYKTKEPVRQFITSGSAEEQVPDKSVFREMFVAALAGDGDVDQDGYVTGSELGEYLQKKVMHYSREAQHPQYGKIRDPKLDKGDFVFAVPVRTQFKIRACAVGQNRRKVEEYAAGDPVIIRVGWKIDRVGSGEHIAVKVRGAGLGDYSWRNDRPSWSGEVYGHYCRLELRGAGQEDYYATVTVQLGSSEQQQQVYFRMVKAPDGGSIDLSEFKRRAAARKTLQQQWQKRLEQMREKYNEVRELDNQRYLSAAEKAAMWQKLEQALAKENNPYSQEDDQMRQYSRERQSYWDIRRRQEERARAEAEQERQRRKAQRLEQERQRSEAQRLAAERAERERKQRQAAQWVAKRSSDGRYEVSPEGVITDTTTHLQWYVGPDERTNWYEAAAWVKKLSVAGGGWRLPTLDELEGIYEKNKGSDKAHIDAVFWNKNTSLLGWSNKTKGSSSACFFHFGYGNGYWYPSSNATRLRGFAVRSGSR